MKPRYKKAKRILTFYFNSFGLKPPYRVLVCGTFCKQALTDKINIAEQLPKYLSAEVQLCTTKCAIKECELGESLLYGPLKVLSQYDLVDCPHTWFKGAPKCLYRLAVKDKAKFIVATQDDELAEKLRGQNVPILHISHNAINLQSPPESSKDVAREKTAQKLSLSQRQEKSIAKLKREMGLEEETDTTKKKKKKKRGPNPLSCKRKKGKSQPSGLTVKDAGVSKAKSRRRKKKKISQLPHGAVLE